MKKLKAAFTSVPGSILIGSVLISLSVLLSGGVIRIKGVTTTKTSPVVDTQPSQPQAQPSPAPGPVQVSASDNPVLGSKSAPLTMIEFSDYECPFCKRYFDSTYPDIKKNYIDTGKLKVIYRNLPLSFHANAHKEAEAALCSRDQGGDDVYFKYHDQIFKRTTSNGTGLALDQLSVIAKDLGLNADQLQQCLDSGKYKNKVDQDLADAGKAGANGTPTFFIGKSATDGTIDGNMIVGAQPFSVFQTTIDSLLR